MTVVELYLLVQITFVPSVGMTANIIQNDFGGSGHQYEICSIERDRLQEVSNRKGLAGHVWYQCLRLPMEQYRYSPL